MALRRSIPRLLLSTAALLLVSCARSDQDSSVIADRYTPEMFLAREALVEARRYEFPGASIERGMHIALGTATCTSAATCYSCYECHGIRGAGIRLTAYPRLAGQSYEYLVRALHDFASGHRPSATMHEVAKALTAQQMRDVAAYFSAVTAAPPLATAAVLDERKVDPQLLTVGARIAQAGSEDGTILACSHCHAPGGVGRPPEYPYLAGQYARYIEDQLYAFRSGMRKGTELRIMEELAQRMSNDQIRAVAWYYEGLPPPERTVPEEREAPLATLIVAEP